MATKKAASAADRIAAGALEYVFLRVTVPADVDREALFASTRLAFEAWLIVDRDLGRLDRPPWVAAQRGKPRMSGFAYGWLALLLGDAWDSAAPAGSKRPRTARIETDENRAQHPFTAYLGELCTALGLGVSPEKLMQHGRELELQSREI